MPKQRRGRPSVDGTLVSFRIQQTLMNIVESGAKLQAEVIARSHPKGRCPSPSNALWLRSLMELSLTSPALYVRLEQMRQAARTDVEMVNVTIKLPRDLQTLLRKLECSIQPCDWEVDFTRNAVLNYLIVISGNSLNTRFKDQLMRG